MFQTLRRSKQAKTAPEISETSSETPPPYSKSAETIQTSSHSHVIEMPSIASHAPPPTATAAAPAGKADVPLRKFQTCIPLANLKQYSAPTDCPVCGQRALTTLKYVIGGYTHLLAVSFFSWSGVFFWVPYVIKAMKNVDHHCGNPDCGVLLARWHRYPNQGYLEVKEFR